MSKDRRLHFSSAPVLLQFLWNTGILGGNKAAGLAQAGSYIEWMNPSLQNRKFSLSLDRIVEHATDFGLGE